VATPLEISPSKIIFRFLFLLSHAAPGHLRFLPLLSLQYLLLPFSLPFLIFIVPSSLIRPRTLTGVQLLSDFFFLFLIRSCALRFFFRSFSVLVPITQLRFRIVKTHLPTAYPNPLSCAFPSAFPFFSSPQESPAWPPPIRFIVRTLMLRNTETPPPPYRRMRLLGPAFPFPVLHGCPPPSLVAVPMTPQLVHFF